MSHPVWREVFGDSNPVEIEIGPGLGRVLLAFASAHPTRNFFAVERQGGLADAVRRKALQRGLTNVRVIGANVGCVLRTLVPDSSVDAYHIYFPDPWPKTRHRERRLWHGSVLRDLARTLVCGGKVYVASDLPAVVVALRTALAAAGLILLPEVTPPARPASSFEQRYARSGVYTACFTRLGREGGEAATSRVRPGSGGCG